MTKLIIGIEFMWNSLIIVINLSIKNTFYLGIVNRNIEHPLLVDDRIINDRNRKFAYSNSIIMEQHYEATYFHDQDCMYH